MKKGKDYTEEEEKLEERKEEENRRKIKDFPKRLF